MGEPKTIETGTKSSGIQVTYTKRRKMISLFGWYDEYIGIAPCEIPLLEFCQKLGITAKDLPKGE